MHAVVTQSSASSPHICQPCQCYHLVAMRPPEEDGRSERISDSLGTTKPTLRVDLGAAVRRRWRTYVQELVQVGDNPYIDQLRHIISLALAELLALDPGGREHAPAGVLHERPGYHHLKGQWSVPGALQKGQECPFFQTITIDSVNYMCFTSC